MAVLSQLGCRSRDLRLYTAFKVPRYLRICSKLAENLLKATFDGRSTQKPKHNPPFLVLLLFCLPVIGYENARAGTWHVAFPPRLYQEASLQAKALRLAGLAVSNHEQHIACS